MSAQIMSMFSILSSSNIDERVSAATSIVHHLTQVEPARLGLGSQPNDCSTSHDLNYTLKRLVRGLASPTPGARLGFSIALCEIINRFPQLSPLSIFDLIISATPLQSTMKASEERDSQFGRLFGIKCITQSGVLLRKLETPHGIRKSTNVSEQTTLLKHLLEELCALARRAPWLSESVGSILVLDITTQILEHPESSLSQSGALDQITEVLPVNAETLTLEQLALAILLQKHSVKLDWASILSKTFTNKQILSEDNHEKLCTILMNVDGIPTSQLAHPGTSEGDSKMSSSNTDLPVCPHFVHGILISASQSASNFNLSTFYNHLFERYYFASKSSPSRRSHGFLILNNLLTSKFIPDQEKPNFLTPNCVHTLKVHLSATDRLLHKMAQSVASSMISQVDTKHAKESALAKGFATRIRAFSLNFDQNTHPKLTRSLVSRMLSPELELWTEELISSFQNGSPTWPCPQIDASSETQESQSSPDSFREGTLTQLCNVINMNTSFCTIDCASSILRCLALCAFFGEVSCGQNGKSPVQSCAPVVPFSPQLRELCKARLYTCLLELVDRTRINSSDKKKQPKTTQVSNPMYGLKPFELVLEVLNSQASSKPREGIQTSECIKSIRKNLKQLRSSAASTKSQKLQNKKEALVLLCDILHLMTYDEQDEWTEALPLIERLKRDLDTLLPPDGDFDVLHHSPSLPPAVANLTECLLFLLSWPIALLRLVVEINFDSFSDCIGAQSLQLLIDHINPPENLPEVEDSDEDKDDSDSPQANGNDDPAAGDSSAQEDSDTDGETVNDDESVDEQFRNDVAMALGHALSKPTVSDDDSEGESDLMNDDEMLALDANLAAIFKRRTGKKLARINSTQDLHLRMKILELIGKFVKLHPAQATRARLLKPLLQLISKINPSEIIMKQKVIKILEDTTRLSCGQSEGSIAGQPLSAAEASEIVATVHLVAQTTLAVDTAESCANCNLWLIEMIQSSSSSFVVENERQEALSKLVEAHQEGLKNFCYKRSSKLRPTFFHVVFKRFPAFGWLLRHDVLLKALDSSTVNTYRREQVLDLVSMLINKYHPDSKSLPEFDAFVCKLKEAIISLKEVIVTSNSEDGLSKDRKAALKALSDLMGMMHRALRKRLTVESSETCCSQMWSAKDIKALSEFATQLPSVPQSTTIIRQMEGLVQFVDKTTTRQVKQPDQANGLKRKQVPLSAPAAEAKPVIEQETQATELSTLVTNAKERKKSKKNRKKEASTSDPSSH